jgi:lipopolysaccharide transport system ATP-binding protein
MMIRTVEGLVVYGTNTDADGDWQKFVKGDSAEISFAIVNNLMPGTYFVSCGVSHMQGGTRAFLYRRLDCLMFRVVEKSRARVASGVVNLWAEHSVTKGVQRLSTSND